MTKTYWYAVQKDTMDDWSSGSYDLDEALEILRSQGDGLIAVIDEGNDPICVREIYYGEAVDHD